MISERISDDIPPQMKILNIVIPILMHFCSFVSNGSVDSRIKQHVVMLLCLTTFTSIEKLCLSSIIKPKMYVRCSTMYKKLHFISRN